MLPGDSEARHLCSALRVPPEPRRQDHRRTGGERDRGSRHRQGRGGSMRPPSLLPPLGGRTQDAGSALSGALFRGVSGTPGPPLPESVSKRKVPMLSQGCRTGRWGLPRPDPQRLTPPFSGHPHLGPDLPLESQPPFQGTCPAGPLPRFSHPAKFLGVVQPLDTRATWWGGPHAPPRPGKGAGTGPGVPAVWLPRPYLGNLPSALDEF